MIIEYINLDCRNKQIVTTPRHARNKNLKEDLLRLAELPWKNDQKQLRYTVMIEDKSKSVTKSGDYIRHKWIKRINGFLEVSKITNNC